MARTVEFPLGTGSTVAYFLLGVMPSQSRNLVTFIAVEELWDLGEFRDKLHFNFKLRNPSYIFPFRRSLLADLHFNCGAAVAKSSFAVKQQE